MGVFLAFYFYKKSVKKLIVIMDCPHGKQQTNAQQWRKKVFHSQLNWKTNTHLN
jgi:hypothetical protein